MKYPTLAIVALAGSLLALPSAAGAEGLFAGDGRGEVGVDDGRVEVDVTIEVPGAPGSPGSDGRATPGNGGQPDTYAISWWAVDFGQDPACLERRWDRVAADSRQAADQIAANRQLDAVADAELRGGPRASYGMCPRAPGAPAIDPTAAQTFADRAAELLPVADPSISGSYAITGLRSWLDLGRPSSFEAEERLDLGPFARTATLRATATTIVEWGDGAVTEHTSAGGGYRDGGPGPADIVHIYIDAVPAATLVVTDTWDITVSVPGLDDISLTWTAQGEAITFPVREVRSVRDR